MALLGPVAVTLDGRPQALPQRQRAVVAALGVERGRAVAVPDLVSRLWDEPPRSAHNAVQVHVAGLRRALGPAFVRSTGGGYALGVDLDQVDLNQFERLVGRGRVLVEEGRAAVGASQLAAADRLWQGGALADVRLSRWLELAADTLEQARLSAMVARLGAELAAGGSAEVLPALAQLSSEHPLREDVHAMRIRALVGAGRTSDALEVFQTARRLLLEEVGVEPGPQLREAQALALAAPADAAGPPEFEAYRRLRLPRPLIKLVGREHQVEDVVTRLGDGSPVVTLVGPGGVGKTQLALAAAHRAAARFRGGAAWVELGELRAAHEVLPRIAQTVGVHADQRDILDAVVKGLGDREVLLVLDNVEHLLEAVPDVAAVLSGCAGLVVLATSREALGVAGESVVPVAPLPLPPAGCVDLDELLSSPAVQLLVERARASDPGFGVRAQDATAMGGIVADLDGLPLALELAAPRLALTGVDDLAATLSLTAEHPARGLPLRQTSLAATLAWSVDPLDKHERALLNLLAVFRGAASLEALTTIGAELVPGGDVLTLFGRLTGKSLAQRVVDSDRRARLGLLETTRSYLVAVTSPDELEALRRVHARWYQRFTAPAPGNFMFRGPSDPAQSRAITREMPDIRSAIDWAWSHDEFDIAAELTVHASWRWRQDGDIDELERLLERVYEIPTATHYVRWRAAHEMHAIHLDNPVRGLEWVDRAVGVARGFGHPSLLLCSLAIRAQERLSTGSSLDAQPDLREAQDIAGQGPPQLAELQYVLHNALWYAAMVDGTSTAERLELGSRIVARARLDGIHDDLGMALHNLSELELELELAQDALAHASEVLQIGLDLQLPVTVAGALSNQGMAKLLLGDTEGARDGVERALRMNLEMSDLAWGSENLIRLAVIATAQNRHREGADLIIAAEQIKERMELPLEPLEQRYLTHARHSIGKAFNPPADAASPTRFDNMTPSEIFAIAAMKSV